jgi:hypothetical protein
MEMRDQSAVQLLGHTVSLGTLLSVVTGFLPFAASLVALIWYIIQIFESDTWRRRVERKRLKRIAKLRAELVGLETLMGISAMADEIKSKLQQKQPDASERADAAAER